MTQHARTEPVHDYAPAPDPRMATFLPPAFPDPDQYALPLPGVQEYSEQLQDAATAPQTAQGAPRAPEQAPAPATAPEGPQPVLAGSFALYITPEHAIVLAYRPEGATEDKQLLVPPFVVELAAQQTGTDPMTMLQQIGKGLL